MKTTVHLKVIGILYCIATIFVLLKALLALAVVGAITGNRASEGIDTSPLIPGVVVPSLAVVAFAGLFIHFGISLWKQRKWALGIVGYILILVSAVLYFPIGTLLGLYAMIVLTIHSSPIMASD